MNNLILFGLALVVDKTCARDWPIWTFLFEFSVAGWIWAQPDDTVGHILSALLSVSWVIMWIARLHERRTKKAAQAQ